MHRRALGVFALIGVDHSLPSAWSQAGCPRQNGGMRAPSEVDEHRAHRTNMNFIAIRRVTEEPSVSASLDGPAVEDSDHAVTLSSASASTTCAVSVDGVRYVGVTSEIAWDGSPSDRQRAELPLDASCRLSPRLTRSQRLGHHDKA